MFDEGIEAIIVSPNEVDVQLAHALLSEYEISSTHAKNIDDVIRRLPDRVGCAIIVEEALDQDVVDELTKAMREQPAWCDFPIIIIGGENTDSASMINQLFPYSGNLTLLSRPLTQSTLISAVRVALRARSRQYQVRDLLKQREESTRRRDEFLAMLAHELRNPLAPIKNAAYLIKMLKIPDTRLEKAQGLIEKQVDHMSRLVNDLLDVSRLELGKVQLQVKTMALNSAVTAAVDSCASLIQGRKHTLTVNLSSEPIFINGDPVRIEQVISNLLTNAAKYTPPGGAIRVETQTLNGNAKLSVQDNGVGISAGFEDGIFELFRQDDRTLARSEGGLGIGLTVVKRLIDLHHGEIEVKSEGVNKGSRFTVSIPLATEPKAEAYSEIQNAASTNSRSILVIEDNPDIRESLELLIKMWGHRVHFAETGPDGVKLAAELKPNVAIIDIGLPGLTGYEVAREIRTKSRDWVSSPKLIALTGYGQPGDVDAAKNAGFDAHLLKPVEPDQLQNMLAST